MLTAVTTLWACDDLQNWQGTQKCACPLLHNEKLALSIKANPT